MNPALDYFSVALNNFVSRPNKQESVPPADRKTLKIAAGACSSLLKNNDMSLSLGY